MSKAKDTEVKSSEDAPKVIAESVNNTVEILSKRETLAAMALQGILAYSQQNYRQHSAIEENIQLAFAYADAILKQTSRKK